MSKVRLESWICAADGGSPGSRNSLPVEKSPTRKGLLTESWRAPSAAASAKLMPLNLPKARRAVIVTKRRSPRRQKAFAATAVSQNLNRAEHVS